MSQNDSKPYQNESINLIYDLLFCDSIEPFKQNNPSPSAYPWSTVFADKFDREGLIKIIEDENLDLRIKILAINKLRTNGIVNEGQDLMAVIIEVGLDEGLDVVAAYGDGSARYINYSGKLIVWENPSEASDALVDTLFATGEDVIKKIGPWDKERLPHPPTGQVRLTFLVSDGLYFGQGPIDVLFNDAMGGPVIEAAMQLMQFLTETQ